MTAPAPPDPGLRHTVVALVLGAAGGAAAAWLRLPLAWMIGAMCVTTVAAAAGVGFAIPDRLRTVMIAVLGIMLGSAFTPDIAGRVARWLPSLAALALYGVAVTTILYGYYRRVAGYDPTTAYFSAVPGGITQMVIIGAAHGGDIRTMSLNHGARVLFVVATIPFWFAWTQGYAPGAGSVPGASPIADIALADLALLAACAPVGVFVAGRLRVPSAALIGPMMLSAALHLMGLSAASPPTELVAAAQVVVGAAIGARFAGFPFARIARILLVALGATAIMLVVTAAFALGMQALTGLGLPALVLSFAPGGLAEMSLIALALGIDAAFVSTHHIVRIVLLVVFAPLVHRLLTGRSKEPAA